MPRWSTRPRKDMTEKRGVLLGARGAQMADTVGASQ